MADPDPALNFFPTGQEVDLYGVLDLKEDAAEADIRKAYRRLALRFHPDKVLSRSAVATGGTVDEDAHTRFQQIGFAYAVLSDAGRRKRYDATGRTDELKFGENGEDVDWDAYFATLWTGNVSGTTLDDFKKKYQHSEEEREEIFEAYKETEGSLAGILSHVPCLEVLEDEERIIGIINEAIKANQLEALPKWNSELNDTKGRERLRNEAKKEASEAEAYAKELGVWDELFGKSGKQGARKQGKRMQGEAEHVGADDDDDEEEGEEEEEDEEDEKPRKGKVKGKGKADAKPKADPKSKATKSAKKPVAKGKKSKAVVEEDDEMDVDGEDRLAALFAKRAKEREGGFNSLVERLEVQARAEEATAAAKKGSKASKAGSNKATKASSSKASSSSSSSSSSKPATRRRSPPAPGMDPDPLDDDAFAKIQADMLKRAEAGKKRKANEESIDDDKERKSALKALADGRKKKKKT